MCPAKRLQSLNFIRPRLGKHPILEPPIFVRFSLFLISYPFQKFDPTRWNDSKVQNFGGPDWGEIPQPGSFDFSFTLVLPDTFSRSNFEYSVFNGLKVDSMEKKRKRE